MTNIRKASGPADLLRLVPNVLGFIPSDSLVVLPMGAGRTLGAMRLDLPALDSEAIPAVAGTVTGMVTQVDRADSVILVQYGGRHDALHDWLVTGFEATEVTLLESLYVTALGWGSFLTDAAGTLEEITPEQVPGIQLREDAGIEPIPACPPNLAGCTPSEDPDELMAVVDSLERYITGGRMHWVSTSVFMALLARPALRDIFLIQTARGEADGMRALAAQLEFEDGQPYPEELARTIWGDGPRPEVERLETALKITRLVLSVRPEPGAYAVAAWLSWAMGRSTHASQYAQLGLELDGEHGMCEIVKSFVAAGHLPGWAFVR